MTRQGQYTAMASNKASRLGEEYVSSPCCTASTIVAPADRRSTGYGSQSSPQAFDRTLPFPNIRMY